jgi:hypothetical protein
MLMHSHKAQAIISIYILCYDHTFHHMIVPTIYVSSYDHTNDDMIIPTILSRRRSGFSD